MGLGFDALVLTTIGRKSGAPTNDAGRLVPRQGRQLADRGVGGRSAGNPAWYYNLAAHPDQVQIEVERPHDSRDRRATPRSEREQAWQQITAAVPRFAQYQQKTDRELPIIRLVPRSG